MNITIIGSGAFGTALAITYARAGRDVTLIGRDANAMKQMDATRLNPRLPSVELPKSIACTSEHQLSDIVLFAVPAQQLASVAAKLSDRLKGKTLVACCKGIDLSSLEGPVELLKGAASNSDVAILTGPSFAADIAKGLPTALTLACKTPATELQESLSTPTLRLYRTEDTIGAELGGALKNVVAIGAGIAIGAGLGDSARAALMTRGFAEMQKLGSLLGAKPETLMGLSGLGDLALTCTSDLSRNFCHGIAMGRGAEGDTTKTVEGVATSIAVRKLAKQHHVELPVCEAIAAICSKEVTIDECISNLMSRPLKEER